MTVVLEMRVFWFNIICTGFRWADEFREGTGSPVYLTDPTNVDSSVTGFVY